MRGPPWSARASSARPMPCRRYSGEHRELEHDRASSCVKVLAIPTGRPSRRATYGLAWRVGAARDLCELLAGLGARRD